MSLTDKEKIKFWKKTSKEELTNAEILYNGKRYVGALFFGHFCLEKILKALVQKTGQNPPHTHDLKILAKLAKLSLTDNQIKLITEINTFNLRTRYEDYKFEFYKKATKKYTQYYLEKIRKVYRWFLKQI